MIWELAKAGLLALSLRAQVLLGLLLPAVWSVVYRNSAAVAAFSRKSNYNPKRNP
ncbi:MAG: hypothetical protein ABSA97_07175 [Verrucomicrobiia bacterium]|jgi:hypothetical protein